MELKKEKTECQREQETKLKVKESWHTGPDCLMNHRKLVKSERTPTHVTAAVSQKPNAHHRKP